MRFTKRFVTACNVKTSKTLWWGWWWQEHVPTSAKIPSVCAPFTACLAAFHHSSTHYQPSFVTFIGGDFVCLFPQHHWNGCSKCNIMFFVFNTCLSKCTFSKKFQNSSHCPKYFTIVVIVIALQQRSSQIIVRPSQYNMSVRLSIRSLLVNFWLLGAFIKRFLIESKRSWIDMHINKCTYIYPFYFPPFPCWKLFMSYVSTPNHSHYNWLMP